MLMGLNKVTDIFGKSDLLMEKEKLQDKVKEAEGAIAVWQGKVEKLKSDLERRTAERDEAVQQLAECKERLAKEQKENYRQFLNINNMSSELRQMKRERSTQERAKQPRMYGIPSVVDMSKFNIMEPIRLHRACILASRAMVAYRSARSQRTCVPGVRTRSPRKS